MDFLISKTSKSKEKACLINHNFKIQLLSFQKTKLTTQNTSINSPSQKISILFTAILVFIKSKQTCNAICKTNQQHVKIFKTLH